MLNNNYRHGKRYTKEYQTWCNVVQRTTNKNRKDYERYGGAGVTLHEDFRSFLPFLNDVGEAPTKDHSLDRIDVNLGYQPGNLRWVLPQIQNQNKGKMKTNTSGVIGVSWAENKAGNGYWKVQWLEHSKKQAKVFSVLRLGYKEAFKQAYLKRLEVVINLNLNGCSYPVPEPWSDDVKIPHHPVYNPVAPQQHQP